MYKLFSTAFVCFLSFAAFAQDGEEKPPAEPVPEPKMFVTEASLNAPGLDLDYTVKAGETYLRDDGGKPRASIFSFAYISRSADAGEARPVTFIWNGGPGSASIWLHMGSVGPRRVVVPSDAGHAGAPPYDLLDNPETLLAVSDLVFIDPVGTGFSRALGEHENKDFWGLNEDAQSMADFIETWLTENRRWNSPKYLLGESFGTTRAAAVAGILEGNLSISLNGIIMVSQALDYAGSTPYFEDNIISYVTFLPTMAATAWYHGELEDRPDDFEGFMDEARRFAKDIYLPALWAGASLTGEERADIVAQLSRFTGLSEDFIETANLRIRVGEFMKELKRDEGVAVGRLDSRYLKDEVDDLASYPTGDAADNAISGAYVATFNHYILNELGVEIDRRYKPSGGSELSGNWNWRTAPEGSFWEPRYVNTAPQLSEAMRINPGLKVMIASGYYDLVTPFFDAEYTFGRYDIPQDRLAWTYYPAGHMMYVHEPSRQRFLEDVRAFIQQ